MIEWILNNWLWLWLLVIVVSALVGLLFTFPLYRRRYRDDERYSVEGGGEAISHASFIKLHKSEIVISPTKKPEWHSILKDEFERLHFGKIMFNPPERMKLGINERIETRISQDSKTDLITSLKGRGIPQIEELKISELMKVRLSGSAFAISPLNEEEQVVTPSEFTEWAWDVSPKKTGKQMLHLHVSLRIRLPFGEEKKDHPVLDREIAVSVNPVYSIKVFFAKYWKWIISALLLPLLGWLLKTYVL